MKELPIVERVTIYAAHHMEKTIIDQVVKLGAKGYTAVDCHGVGDRGSVTDPFTPITQVRIEVLANSEVAMKIMDYLKTLRGRSVIACVDAVRVADASRY